MKFKVVLYEAEEGFTVFCPGLRGCISEGDTEEEALENIQSAIREYLEAVWIMTKENIAKDVEEDGILNVTFADVEVDIEGVEDAEAEQVEALT
jgi:predicted RNase H-like HicB family nuclease